MVLVAREVGRLLPESGADWYEQSPLEVAESQFGEEAASEALNLAAAGDPHVRRYIEEIRAYRASLPPDRAPAPGEPRPPQRPLPFALTFDAFRAVVLETSPPPVLRLAILRAFYDRPFPGAATVLLDVLSTGDEEVVSAVWTTLRRVDAPEVRARAREELGKPRPNLEALGGLQQDLRSEDVPLVASALAATTDPDEHHLAGLILMEVLDARGGPHLASLLLTVYEQGCCGLCREEIVLQMLKLGVAPRAVIEECRYDAYLELRAGAAAWLSRHPEPSTGQR